MANFEAKKISLSDINGGVKYENGDVVDAEAINAPIEAAAFAQSLATNQPNVDYAGNVGTPSVTIEEMAGGGARFVFLNLKGERGKDGEDHSEEITELRSEISKNKKRITNIEQGLMADDFETDSTVAYSKTVPSNSLPYAAIGNIGGITISKAENLIEYPYKDLTKQQFEGITFTDNGDGSITINGYPEGYVNLVIATVKLQIGTYHLSGFAKGYQFAYLAIKDKTNNVIYNDEGNGVTFTVLSEGDFDIFFDIESMGETFSNVIVYPKLNEGSGASLEKLYPSRVTEIKSEGKNSNTFSSLEIPTEVQNLDGYGDGINSAYTNVVDYAKRKYTQWVRRLLPNEKTLTLAGYVYNNIVYYQIPKAGTADSGTANSNILVSSFPVYSGSSGWDSANRIGTVTGAATYTQYWFGFPVGTTLEQAQAVIEQEDILVTLPSAEITDISHLLSGDNYIQVEGGGTITFVNDNKQAVPSDVIYQLKEVAE